MEGYGVQELSELVGHEVVDANGEKIGYVDLVFLDVDTGRPEWLGIWNGIWDTKPRVIVPIRGIERVKDEIKVPWTKDVVESAPSYDDEDDRGLFSDEDDRIGISPEKERQAYAHYSISPETPVGDAPRLRAWRITVRAEAIRR